MENEAIGNKRDKLSEALSNVMLENLNQDVQAMIDMLESFPDRLNEKIEPNINQIYLAASELLEATKDNGIEAKKELNVFRDEIIINISETTEKICASKIESSIKKLNTTIDKINNIEKKEKSNISFMIIGFIFVILSFFSGLSGSYLFNNHYQEKINSQQIVITKILNATKKATISLDKKNQNKFTNVFNEQLK